MGGSRLVVGAVLLGLVWADCDSVLGSAAFGDFRTCSRGQVKASLEQQARCEPRPVVLRLPWPNSTHVGGGVQQMTPTHVSVLQCGGGCHRGSEGCLAVRTRRREVSVMVGRCGVSVGKCEKECAVVSVEEHTECGCGCHIKQEECEASGLHKFGDELCACECRDTEAKRRCLEQGRAWEKDTCTCGCPVTVSCNSGNVYSATTCMCEPVNAENSVNEHSDGRTARDYFEDMVGWEVVTIAILLFLVLALLSVIFSLLARLHRMRRALKLKDFSVMEGEYHVYGELPARRVTERQEDREGDKTYLEIASVSSSSGFGSDVSKDRDRESPAAVDTAQTTLSNERPVQGSDETVYRSPAKASFVEPGVRELGGGTLRRGVTGTMERTPRAGAGEAVPRCTKSGIFRGPVGLELARPAGHGLHPIDEALRLLQESALQL